MRRSDVPMVCNTVQTTAKYSIVMHRAQHGVDSLLQALQTCSPPRAGGGHAFEETSVLHHLAAASPRAGLVSRVLSVRVDSSAF